MQDWLAAKMGWPDWLVFIKQYQIMSFRRGMLGWLAVKMGLLDWLVFIKKYHIIGFWIEMADWLATKMGWPSWLVFIKECRIDWQPRWVGHIDWYRLLAFELEC
jgi:hypothetical protein